MSRINRSLVAATVACLLAVVAVSDSRTDEPKTTVSTSQLLHQRIDQVVEAYAIGPLAGRCDDSDFLRRIYLDLTGIIPSAEKVRAFLSNAALDNRESLIDELLNSSEFNRHFTMQLNVHLLERRTDKVVKLQDWERLLYESIAERKPLDQLFSELIFIESPDNSVHPASKFIFTREAEPNALTRDIGRLVFGMDLQCAQCHNHPLIDTYYQEDYYGLYAFVNRTSLFTDPKSKEVRLAEKADGEANFKSVFTGDSRDRANPRLPKEFSLFSEPTFVARDQYRVKPEKNTAGQPKFSRREALAKMLSSSQQFQRNLANRIWSLMFSRGIVHPLDFHHAANSPNNPALLQLLSQELKSNGFQIRPLLREIALSRTYQRSCEPPQAETINFADIAARSMQLAAKRESSLATVAQLTETAALREAAYRELMAKHDSQAVEILRLSKSVADAHQALDKALAALKPIQESLDKLRVQSRAVAEAADKLNAASLAIPEDKELADAAAKIASRATQFANDVEKSSAALTEKTGSAETARSEVSQAETAFAAASASRVDPELLKQLENAQIESSEALSSATHEIHAIEWRIGLCKVIEEFKSAERTDAAKAESLWQTIVDQWTIAGQVAPLKPLTPEQLAASAMQATGMMVPQVAAVQTEIDKSPPEGLKTASDSETDQLKNKFVQLQLIETLRGTLGQFATQYGGLPGEDFQATVNQALFFGNGSIIDGWLKPVGENLAVRLLKMEGQNGLAGELYTSILSRPPTELEKQDVATTLDQFRDDRAQAISELMWALLSSTEFRFNH